MSITDSITSTRCRSAAAQLLLRDDAVSRHERRSGFIERLVSHFKLAVVYNFAWGVSQMSWSYFTDSSGMEPVENILSRKNSNWMNLQSVTFKMYLLPPSPFFLTANWASWLQLQASCWCVTTPWWAAALCGFLTLAKSSQEWRENIQSGQKSLHFGALFSLWCENRRAAAAVAASRAAVALTAASPFLIFFPPPPPKTACTRPVVLLSKMKR